jgi:hypothetical protein
MPRSRPTLHSFSRSTVAMALSYALAFAPVAVARVSPQQQPLQQAAASQQQGAQPMPSAIPLPASPYGSTMPTDKMQASPAPPRKQDQKRAKEAAKRGQRAAQAGDWQAAFEAYDDAAHWDPENLDDLQGLAIARAHVVQAKLDAAEKDAVSGLMPQAIRELREARLLDPSNKVVAARLIELSALDPSTRMMKEVAQPQLAAPVLLEHASGVQTFRLRGSTQGAYEEIARRFGVDVAFDVDVRERPVRIDLVDVDFPTVTRVLGEATGTFWRPLSKHLFFVAPDTTQKRKDYEVSVVRTVMFPASETNDQITEISRLVREIAGVTRTDLDTQGRTLTMRASPQAMAVASGLIEDLEKPVAELVLEVMIIEMDRNKNEVLGVLPPQTAKIYSIPSGAVEEAESGLQGLITVLQQIFGQPTSLSGLTSSQIAQLLSAGAIGAGVLIPPLFAFGGGKTTFIGTLPGATATLSDALGSVHSGRRMMLRAGDGQAATFFVGERYPVSLAQYSASLGSSTGVSIPGASTTNFPITTLNTGVNPDFTTVGDFNADNFQDLVVANYTDGTISTYLGNGDGTFLDPTVTTVGAGPAWIATGSFNANTSATPSDTNLDMAVANQNSNTISILLGNGDGTFATGTPLTTGNSPVCVIATDLNGDGFPDLIVANKTDNTLEVFIGAGNGTFTALKPFATGGAPTSIVSDDFNADGKIDIAVTNSADNTMELFFGNGDGTFGKGVVYATGVTPLFVTTGDFNGDGFVDLVVADSGAPTSANEVGNSVSVFLGNGDGTFGTTSIPRLDAPAGTNPTSIAVADYNVDGRPDLAVTAQGDNSVALLLGNGDGTFSTFFELALGTAPDSCVTTDFNGDAIPDLAVTNNGSNTASIILNSSSFIGNTTGDLGTQFPNAEYIDLGLKVKATPRVHNDDEVTLQFEMTISSLAGQSFNNIPVVNNEELHQTVRVKMNEAAEIAQYITPQSTMNVNGTPYLGEIAHSSGGLAGQSTETTSKTELLILVTPRLVAFNPRKDHVIYAGRGSLEGAGSFGFTQQERRGGLNLPAPTQPQQPPPDQQQPPPSDQPAQQPPVQGAVPQPPNPNQQNPPVTNPPGQTAQPQ